MVEKKDWSDAALVEGLKKLRDKLYRTGTHKDVLVLLDAASDRIKKLLPAVIVDLDRNVLYCDGKAISLPPRQAELCQVLARRGFASYDSMISGVWGDAADIVDPKNHLHQYKTKINTKMSEEGCNFKIISHHGQGFELCRS